MHARSLLDGTFNRHRKEKGCIVVKLCTFEEGNVDCLPVRPRCPCGCDVTRNSIVSGWEDLSSSQRMAALQTNIVTRMCTSLHHTIRTPDRLSSAGI